MSSIQYTKKIALVDCNSFYVSCERLFNPKIRKKPVIKEFEQFGKPSDLNIYFFELNSTNLHVFHSQGFSLSGTKNIYQYVLKNGKFYKNDKPLLSYLS